MLIALCGAAATSPLWLEVACEERRDRSVDRGRLLAVEARRV